MLKAAFSFQKLTLAHKITRSQNSEDQSLNNHRLLALNSDVPAAWHPPHPSPQLIHVLEEISAHLPPDAVCGICGCREVPHQFANEPIVPDYALCNSRHWLYGPLQTSTTIRALNFSMARVSMVLKFEEET